ncbi:MAG TPA: DUF3800 domain-containing protein [Mycobacteriales bacterium]|nr:DUF3800 domain-containing protein [Mycobacteriales bacterium]
MWRAYVDESESNQRVDPHTYLLAAALVHDEHAADVRAEVRGLLRPGQRKLHWRDESTESRARIIKTIAALPALHVVVVRTGRDGEPIERRRRKCFERLAYELAARDIDHIAAEARQSKNNLREMDHVKRLRAVGAVRAGMRLSHVPGPNEPLLWIADVVAGAMTAARTGTPDHLGQLAGLVDVVLLGTEP